MQRIGMQGGRAVGLRGAGAPPSRAEAADDRAEIADLWRIPRCRWRMIAAVAATCTLFALLLAAASAPRFAAVAQILIDPRDRQIVAKDVTPDTLAADGGVLQVESQARVIESDAVLLGAVRALHLADDPEFGAPPRGLAARVKAFLLDSDDAASTAEDRALRALRKRLTVKRADKVFVVDVVVTAASGREAARIADAVAEAYLADQARARAEASSQASAALGSRLEALRAGATAAADAVERFKAAHDLVGTDKQLISDQQLSDNGLQLDAARGRVAELQARADQIDGLRRAGGDAGAVQEAVQSPVVTQLRASLTDAVRRQSDLRTRLGARHPDLIAVDAEVGQIHRQIEAELARLARAAHSDLDRARKGERALGDDQARLKLRTIASDGASVTLQELIRERDARRAVYQSFLARAGETKEQSAVDDTNARIISRAVPPVQPSWPMRAVLLFGGPIVGLGLGTAAAFLAEYIAPTVLSAGQLADAAGAPVIGTLPQSGGRAGSRRAAPSSPAAGAAPRAAVDRLCGPLSALRRRLRPHTVLVCSARAVQAAGVDVAGALVRASVDGGASTLIVRAREEDGPRPKGLCDVLDGSCSVGAALLRDGRTGHHRLAWGARTGAGASIAGSDGRLDPFDAFLEAAGQTFDIVVFDLASAPPALASAVAARADDVLFAARRDWTSRREVADAAETLMVGAGRPITAALLVAPSGGS